MREISLDTETTGLSHKEGHRIIEIGAVEIVNHYPTGKHFHVYVNPQFEVSAGAGRVHGLTNEFLSDKPLFETVAEGFLDFIADSRLIIHNAPFDIGFLNHHLKEINMPLLEYDRVFDTLTHARKTYPGQKNTLDALCTRLSVESAHRVLHGALLDAELLADVYAEMMGAGANQRNLLFRGDSEGEVDTGHQSTNPVLHFGETSKTYEPREFGVTEEEQEAHRKFLEKIGAKNW